MDVWRSTPITELRALRQILATTLELTKDNSRPEHLIATSFDRCPVVQWKIKVVDLGALELLCEILKSPNVKHNEVLITALTFINQFSMIESLHQKLLQRESIRLVMMLAQNQPGNSPVLKICFHTVVRLINAMESPGSFDFQSLAVCLVLSWMK